MNSIIIIGRIGQDPKKIDAGTKTLAEFSVGVNRPFKNANGESETDWFNVKAWGQTADYVLDYLEKGRQVVVKGRMEARKYEKDGKTQTIWNLVADQVNGLDRPRDDAPKAQPSRRPATQKTDEYDPFGDE